MAMSALEVIRAEHRALAGVLQALRGRVRAMGEGGGHGEPAGRVQPGETGDAGEGGEGAERDAVTDFAALRALLFYIDAYPERLHHPKESELLFRQMRRHGGSVVRVLDRLDADHARGEAAIRDLQYQLLELEMLGEGRLATFADAVEVYAERYLEHMGIEEREVLPLAATLLAPDELAALDAAFAANRDPLTGHEPVAEFGRLFQRIRHLLPPPA